jgi:hypothetical protein
VVALGGIGVWWAAVVGCQRDVRINFLCYYVVWRGERGKRNALDYKNVHLSS